LKPDDDSVPFEIVDHGQHSVESGTVAEVSDAETIPKQVWALCHEEAAAVQKPHPVRPLTGALTATGQYRPPRRESRGKEKLIGVIQRYSLLQQIRDEKIAERMKPKPSRLKAALEHSVAAIRYEAYVTEKRKPQPDFPCNLGFKLPERLPRNAQTRPVSPRSG
jgi:hypothetical protein